MTLDLEADYLRPRPANHRPMTPMQFLFRAVDSFGDRVAIIHGEQRWTWRDYAQRCLRLASALRRAGVGPGDIVAVLLPNTPPMLEAHFGVPLAGAVLNTLNTRLDPAAVAYILAHAEAKVFLVDTHLSATARAALQGLPNPPLVIDVDDEPGGQRIGDLEYEAFLAGGDPSEPVVLPADEFDALSLNYTSGTTGHPKGVLYHHRGAYLNALGQLLHHRMDSDSVYLWVLPLFHCNGWCYSWGAAAVGATHVCLRRTVAADIFDAIAAHNVTHFCAAPTVLSMLTAEAARSGRALPHPVAVMTAGAAPPPTVLAEAEALGFRLRHVYGMTEMHGVTTLCDWHSEWDALPPADRARRLARQGVRNAVTDDMIVADPVTLVPVPADGETMGEIMIRGNGGMKGYLKDPVATEAAFAGGWYRSGDLAVLHPDGYAEIRDRAKDIIISGGENISSIELEDVLHRHPAVQSAVVVAMKDAHWGETPCAFVELRDSQADGVTEDDLIGFCRAHLAGFKLPRKVVFGPIERTATGKVQKFRLRALLAAQDSTGAA